MSKAKKKAEKKSIDYSARKIVTDLVNTMRSSQNILRYRMQIAEDAGEFVLEFPRLREELAGYGKTLDDIEEQARKFKEGTH